MQSERSDIAAPCQPNWISDYVELPPSLASWWYLFFTVNLLVRHGNDLLVRYIDALREAVRITRQSHLFVIHGWVVLPDHLHCVIELPPADHDFALRWRLIKLLFSRAIPGPSGVMPLVSDVESVGYGNGAIGST